MIARRYTDVVGSLSRVCGAAGMRITDTRLKETINLVQERLISEGVWTNMLVRSRFCLYDGCFALPGDLEAVRHIIVEDIPVPVMSQWFSFLDHCPADLGQSLPTVVEDYGEHPLARLSATARQLRLFSYGDERVGGVRPKMRIYGLNDSSLTVYGADGAEGEEVEFAGDGTPTNYATTVSKFSRVTRVVKPATKFESELYWYDSTTGYTYFAGRYQPGETVPMFRHYHLPFLLTSTESTSVVVLATKRFVPVVSDYDLMAISSLPALRYGVRAVVLEDAGQFAEAEAVWQLAVKALKLEHKRWLGVRRPPVQMTGLTSFGDVLSQL